MRRNNNSMPMRGGGGGGPLMTDHLQDLELELELLKSKRQLIQRQQSDMMFSRHAGDNMRFNQPQSYDDRFGDPQQLNFSHLYNEAPRTNQSFGLKRQAQTDWSSGQNNGSSLSGNFKRPRPSPFVQDNTPSMQNLSLFQSPGHIQTQPLLRNTPKPLMNFPVQRNRPHARPINKQNQNKGPKPLTQHPNFKQNKPNKSNNRPGFTPNKKQQNTNSSPKKPVQNTPRPVQNTPKRVQNTPKASPIKPESVKTIDNIFTADKKPNNKLNGRLELALGMVVKEMKATYGDKPEYVTLFNNINLSRLIKQSIRERLHKAMLGKPIERAIDILAIYRQENPLDTDKDIMELAQIEQRKNQEKIVLAIELLEEGDPEQYFKRNMHRLLHARFDEMIIKLERLITEENKNGTNSDILANLPDIKTTPEAATPSTEAATPSTEAATPSTEAPKDGEEAPKAEEGQKAEEPPKSDAEKPADAEPEKIEEAKETPINVVDKEQNYNKWLEMYVKRKLPGMVAKHRNMLLKIFDLDRMYSNTRAAIILNTNNKALAKKAKDNDQSRGDPDLPRNLPYFAKVLASPSIPKRSIMQGFLNQFGPKIIKRHKKNINLLFIGFDSKDNYDRILAANDTMLDGKKLTIVGNISKTTTANGDDLDQLLTPQLDDQIDDLLSSIRKADEEIKAGEVDLTADSADDAEETAENTTTENVENETTETTENTTTENVENETAETIEEAANGAEGNGKDNGAVGDGNSDDCEMVEENSSNVVTIEDDEVTPLPEVKAPATPAKGRAPATPNSVRTRRSSRLLN